MNIIDHTAIARPLLVPELRLHLITPQCSLWYATEEQARAAGLSEPYWAFAWAGGQAVARYVLDHPGLFAGRSVLDFGAGGGIVGIAAARVGARVLAADIDTAAIDALMLNAALNDVRMTWTTADLVGSVGDWDVVLAGDVTYEMDLAEHVLEWFLALTAAGKMVLFGDPQRGFIDPACVRLVAQYDAPADNDPGEEFFVRSNVYAVIPGFRSGWQ